MADVSNAQQTLLDATTKELEQVKAQLGGTMQQLAQAKRDVFETVLADRGSSGRIDPQSEEALGQVVQGFNYDENFRRNVERVVDMKLQGVSPRYDLGRQMQRALGV